MKEDAIKAQTWYEQLEQKEAINAQKLLDNRTQRIVPHQRSWRTDRDDRVKKDKLRGITLRLIENHNWWRSCLPKEKLVAYIAIRSFLELQIIKLELVTKTKYEGSNLIMKCLTKRVTKRVSVTIIQACVRMSIERRNFNKALNKAQSAITLIQACVRTSILRRNLIIAEEVVEEATVGNGTDIVAAMNNVKCRNVIFGNNVGCGNERMLDPYGFINDRKRSNLTYNGLTYNCTKCWEGSNPGDVTKYYSCMKVYHTVDNTWRMKRQTKDKVDSGKRKCDGTLIIQYEQLSGYTIRSRIINSHYSH
jgi:hypothetical protein